MQGRRGEKEMARINLDTIEKLNKDRNTVHTPVTATYTVFDTTDGEHYVQIDTYGKNDREIPGKASQSIQFDKVSAKFLVDLLKKEFNL